jgi:hypothetical protein
MNFFLSPSLSVCVSRSSSSPQQIPLSPTFISSQIPHFSEDPLRNPLEPISIGTLSACRFAGFVSIDLDIVAGTKFSGSRPCASQWVSETTQSSWGCSGLCSPQFFASSLLGFFLVCTITNPIKK